MKWKMAYVAPTPGDFKRCSGREGTTTIDDLLLRVEEAGDSLPRIVPRFVSLLAAEMRDNASIFVYSRTWE